MEVDEVINTVKNSLSVWESKTALKIGVRKMRRLITQYSIDTSHFIRGGKSGIKRVVYETRVCPVCIKPFTISKNKSEKYKQITCSHSCSNIHFKRLPDSKRHNVICFKYHKKECVVCCEKLIVEAHHYDENHENNDPINFVPLCPTHHQYYHSKHRNLIIDKIESYHKNFVSKYTSLV